MLRTPRLLAVATLAALWIGAVPAAAAPAAGWSLIATFSPLDWIRHLWAEEGTDINTWGRTAPAAGGIASPGVPRWLWAETGSSISPWGEPAPVLNNTGAEINSRVLQ
ncbi:MAG TPA: hypothetical protein VN851_11620 [Thermoanaerobaculia bacterium]|nr:hypothetical protein [Thermoanaerobaculia bacterium]